MPLGQKHLLCRDNPGQREGRGNNRLDFAAFDVADQVGEHFGFEDRAAKQAQVLEVERPEIQIGDRAGDRTRNAVAPATFETVQDAGKSGAADDIDGSIEVLSPNSAARSASRGIT